MSVDPEWSVVVATHGRAIQLRHCLESLRRQEGIEPEIIVVDNSLGDAPTRQASSEAGAQYVLEPVTGLSRARTVGARAARGEFVAFIDDDALADTRWLSQHRMAFSDPAVGGTTGPISPLSDYEEATDDSQPPGRFAGSQRRRLDLTESDWFERANFGGIGNGGNMAFRRHLFASGWGFHEDLGLPEPMGGEENFAFYELVKHGWRIEYVPTAEIQHPAWRPEELRAYRVRQSKSAATYVAFLLINARGHRWSTIRYAAGFVTRKKRDWRPGDHGSKTTGLPRMPVYALAAPLMYSKRHFSLSKRLNRTPPSDGPLLGRPTPVDNADRAG